MHVVSSKMMADGHNMLSCGTASVGTWRGPMECQFFVKMAPKLLPVPVLAADFDFVYTVCYYNVYFTIAGPYKRKYGVNGLEAPRGQTENRNMAASQKFDFLTLVSSQVTVRKV